MTVDSFASTAPTVSELRVASVNLMPPEVADAARARQMRLLAVTAVVLALLVVVALDWHARKAVHSAQTQVATAQAQNATDQHTLASLQSVANTQQQVSARKALLASAMNQEIRWSYVLGDLGYRLPDNAWLTTMTATETPATSGSTTGTTAGTGTSTLGTVTFSGVGLTRDSVATWLDSLAKEKGFAEPTFSSATEAQLDGRTVDDFSTSVNLTDKALSHRYDTTASGS